MEVYAISRTKVRVNPQDVINGLIEKAVGRNGWVFEEKGGYYRGFETGGGNHSWDDQEAISKEEYDYVIALQLVLKTLNEKNK